MSGEVAKEDVVGRVKTYNQQKGYGFITVSRVSDDVFVHITDVEGLNGLVEGHKLEFDVVKNEKGWKAVNARKVPGSKINRTAARKGGRSKTPLRAHGVKESEPTFEKDETATITNQKKQEPDEVPEQRVSAHEPNKDTGSRTTEEGSKFVWKGGKLVRRDE